MKLSKLNFCVVFVIALLVGQESQARVFDFKSEILGSYFRGTGGLSLVDEDAYANSSDSLQFNDGADYNFSGEIGFLFNFRPTLSFRLGFEVLKTNSVEAIKATNSAGTEMYKVTSSVLVLNPIATMEIHIPITNQTRFTGFLGTGLSGVTVDNEYTQVGGSLPDFEEKMEGSLISYHTGVGFETLFVDTVTIMAELGYRYMPISELKYKHDVAQILSQPGSAVKGATVLNDDSSKRSLDMSGFFIGLGCRFYIDFI